MAMTGATTRELEVDRFLCGSYAWFMGVNEWGPELVHGMAYKCLGQQQSPPHELRMVLISHPR